MNFGWLLDRMRDGRSIASAVIAMRSIRSVICARNECSSNFSDIAASKHQS